MTGATSNTDDTYSSNEPRLKWSVYAIVLLEVHCGALLATKSRVHKIGFVI